MKRITLLLLTAFVACSVFAQNILYTKNYDSGGGVDNGNAIAASGTGEYYMTGNTNITPNLDIHLVKVDAATGNLVWAKQYDSGAGSLQQDDGTDITAVSNGFLLTGSVSKEFLPADKDAFLVKVDTAGAVIWQKTIGGANIDVTRTAAMLADSSFLLTGYTNDVTLTGGLNANDVYIIKIDKDGNILNQKAFGGIGNDEGFGITPTSDGGAIVVGSYSDAGATQLYVLKIKSDGDTAWTKRYGATITIGYSVTENPDKSIAITGEESQGSKFLHLRLLDENGNNVWNKNIRPNGISSAMGKSIIRTVNGYLVSGQFETSWMLMRCNLNGDTLWTTMGPSGSIATDLLWDSNGDYAFTGSLPDNNTDFMLIKAFDCMDIAASCSASGTGFNADFTGDAVGGHPAYTYVWTGDGGFSSSSQNPSFSYTADGTYNYQLIVTDNRACADTCTGSIVITGLNDLAMNKNISITVAPNPFSASALLSIKNLPADLKNASLSVIDLPGKEIISIPLSGKGRNGEAEITLNRENLPGGVYFFRIREVRKTIANGKFIIE